jgi:DNA repair exonuclease SbcCD ATPase subunit
LEEKLQKAEADRHNVEENLGEKLRAKIERLEEVERSLGHRSSYASQAAESARALVEMTEGQKRQLESQLKRLTKENIDIQFQLQTMVQNSNVLTTEVEYLRDRAHEEARTTVEADMDAFRKEVSRLEEEKRQLQFELEETQKSSRRERVARQQVEEKLETLEQKVSRYESGKQQSQVTLSTYTDEKCFLENRFTDCEQNRGTSHIPTTRIYRERAPYNSERLHHNSGDKAILRQQLVPRSLQTSSVNTESAGSGSCTRTENRDHSRSSLINRLSSRSPSPQFYVPNTHGSNTHTLATSLLHSTTVRSETERPGYYSRSVDNRRTALHSQTRETLQCLRCGSKFSVTNLDGYEKHIGHCYRNE